MEVTHLMSEEITTKDWLEAELAAVILKMAEVETAKVQYLESYGIAKTRLQKGKDELEALVAKQP